jgi:hypothetical protein
MLERLVGDGFQTRSGLYSCPHSEILSLAIDVSVGKRYGPFITSNAIAVVRIVLRPDIDFALVSCWGYVSVQ